MKKLLIGMLITCSLGLAACGRNKTENPSTNNNSGTGVTDGTNGTGVHENNGMNGTNGTGTTDGTNSNTNGTNNQGASLNESRTSVNNLYTEFNEKVAGGVENIKSEDWDKYSTEFKGKLTNLRNTVKDASIRSTLDDMENLFNEYDTAIREKKDVAKDKVESMKTKIENSFK
ncbi:MULTISPECIES: hypothetical protein [unclassified Clostridium]|uniref:hypothetical protein n=1 Tax=unclassified Clostridium TaxID=2614128 RepID=UPI00290AFBA1|nr:hypothetical protein [Clostridium sp.]MDU5107240.1 hypothetical protein [Clostridium sp.]